MSRKSRSNLAVGLLLVLVGGWLLALQLFPSLGGWFWGMMEWPVYVIGGGVCLLVIGLMVGAPGFAIPAAIVSGIGGILYYQNATGDWDSWSYVWTLIPGFVGVGVIIASLLGEGRRKDIRSGLNLVSFSLILFLIFGTALGPNPLGPYWPVLLIAFGVWLVLKSLVSKK